MEGHRVLSYLFLLAISLSLSVPVPDAFCFSSLGCQVASFGTGNAVRLPGPSMDKPNIYPFGTTYERMYKELKAQDEKL